jgi:hypothetical protein
MNFWLHVSRSRVIHASISQRRKTMKGGWVSDEDDDRAFYVGSLWEWIKGWVKIRK